MWMRMAFLLVTGPERAPPGTSGHPAPEARRQDGELFTILGHRAARDPQPLPVQQLSDALIGERLFLVLLFDQGLDDVFGGPRRDVLAIFGLETAGEEELQLEHAARRLHVFTAADATHRRFVHVD